MYYYTLYIIIYNLIKYNKYTNINNFRRNIKFDVLEK